MASEDLPVMKGKQLFKDINTHPGFVHLSFVLTHGSGSHEGHFAFFGLRHDGDHNQKLQERLTQIRLVFLGVLGLVLV